MPVTELSPPLPPYYRPCRGSVIPPYSPEPSAGEESLSRPSPVRSPRGEFVQSNGRITLTLKEQAENSAAPTYAPGGLVTGKISIQGSESVTEVVLKLTGRLDLAASNGGQPTELVKDSYTVWSDSMRFLCPPSIPFSFIFPSTFKDGDQTWPLPPSLRIAPPGKPFTYVKCTYTLSVVVSTALHPRFSLWRGEKTLSVPINFKPTAFPPRPIPPDPNLFPTIKTAPEEWHQILCDVGHQLRLKNIQCSLFIPSVLIYGLSDSIPFHLQSSGPAAILKGMIQPLSAESKTQHPVRVHLTRRVSLLVRGERQHRNIDIGEGVLSILPPPCYSELLDPRDASIDWAGVIQCNDITATGTFDSGILYVKDFVVVSIPAWRLEHKFQIQLVSNTWHDTGPVGDQV
ncbi:hypothetical protein DFH08DRAFT_837071 [Mycena albidolilacea]|uniref:Uncharacterized protein n=1 Tax=Mycena albidolilacea TaxID=1033008 RepID=A0AAD7ASS1_9AGAR|nr:hypothetical protein DFH08DRAFT_837071 [Mycena albidolilacea]